MKIIEGELVIISCLNDEESRAVEQRLLDDGWSWVSGSRELSGRYHPCLVVPGYRNPKNKTFAWADRNYSESGYRNITAKEFLGPVTRQLTFWPEEGGR